MKIGEHQKTTVPQRISGLLYRLHHGDEFIFGDKVTATLVRVD
jgi:hypothetical protein